MYTSFFGLKENPFNLTPDPRYLYLSPYHREALDHLLYGINERKGFIAVIGGIGTGKTTLCRVLLEHLKEDTRTALIFNSFISDIELLKSINQEFGIQLAEDNDKKKTHIDALNQFLLGVFKEGGNAVVLIDEAQNLSRDVLEQIRMLSNLETEKEKLVQIILVGQPELKELLSSNSLRQLDERITVRYELRALSYKDIRGYVEHRLAVAGGHGSIIFSNGAIKKIYSYSRGNPRRINSVCDRSLLVAYVGGKHIITPGIAFKAIKDLKASSQSKNRYIGWSWKSFFSSAFLVIILIIAAGLGGWSFQRDIIDNIGNNRTNEQITSKTTDIRPNILGNILLDEQQSLSGLIKFYRTKIWIQDDIKSGLNLLQYNIQPEHYVTFKKPFRVLIRDANSSSQSSQYLLICRTTAEGAVVIDSTGKEQMIERDYLMNNWGNKVTCIYPFKGGNMILNKGMKSPDVLNLQSTLNLIGYLLNPTGVYDEATFRNIIKYQENIGLLSDGIAGPRTLALLYQMKEFNERY